MPRADAKTERKPLWRVELITGRAVEVLGWWPDLDTAKAIAGHYRRECPGGVVRVRREVPK